MNIVSGSLVKRDKSQIQANDALADAEIIGFYFSAHWCGPCREFTPLLVSAYEEMKKLNYKFEVVFVSFDENEESLFDYMKESHGDWYALPYGSTDTEKLKIQFNIEGIPTLIIVNKDGTLVNDDGIDDIEAKGAEAYKDWIK
ncbi:nucleoredoxin-like protein 2 [Centruroides vittatus]|uniref:nucleoredoxin-like protein 2 n=1 Tax=Centruroides vittatus TaxID=120091 RepID=UPI0035100CAE